AAARIGERLIKDRLVAALDYWAIVRWQTREEDAASWKRLVQTARLGDLDPWRNRIPDALGRQDVKAPLEVAQPRKVATLPSATLVVLGHTLSAVRQFAAAEQVLRQAQEQHPADFWLNHELAWCCSKREPPKKDDAVRFMTAALALRSQS